jgi:Domain of Unknown Function with PDB structure (DUF3857)
VKFFSFILSLICSFVCLVSASGAQAGGELYKNANSVIEKSDYVYTIEADGSYRLTSKTRLMANTEKGRRAISKSSLFYNPATSKLSVLAATALSNSAKNAKSIPITKDLISEKTKGVIVVSFPHLEMGWSAEYETEQQTSPLLSGVFDALFEYGNGVPELAGHVVLKSHRPLLYRVDDSSKSLKLETGREGQLYTLSIELTKPAYFDPIESMPYLERGSVPRVQVTTAQSWNEVAVSASKVYERAIGTQLPAKFSEIVSQTAGAKSASEKMDLVHSKVSRLFKVESKRKNALAPKTLSQLLDSKTATSADLAAAEVAVLRKLGLKANVALVRAGSPYEAPVRSLIHSSSEESVPVITGFTQALVAVQANGQTLWIDPADPASRSDYLGDEVADNEALVLDRATKSVTVARSLKKESLVQNVKLKFDKAGSATATGDLLLVGDLGAPFRRELAGGFTTEAEDYLASTILRMASTRAPFFLYDRNPYARGDFKTTFNFVVDPPTAAKPAVPLPYPNLITPIQEVASNRKTPLYLGRRSKAVATVEIEGKQIDSPNSRMCQLMTRWMDVNRTVESTVKGVRIVTTVNVKEPVIPTDGLKSQEYRVFAAGLKKCVTNASFIPVDAKSAAEITTVADAQKSFETQPSSDNANIVKIKDVLTRHIAKQPNSKEARVLLARVITAMGMDAGGKVAIAYAESAQAALGPFAKDESEDFEFLKLRAQINVSLGQLALANQDFNHLRLIRPNDTSYYGLGANLSLAEGKYIHAEAWLQLQLASAKDSDVKSAVVANLEALYQKTNEPEKAKQLRDSLKSERVPASK